MTTKSKLDLFIFYLIFTSLYFGSFFDINIGFKITLTDISLLLALLSFFLSRKKIILTSSLLTLMSFLILCFLLEFFMWLFLDLGDITNLSLSIAILRNLILVFIVSQLNLSSYIKSYKLFNYLILIGVIMSLIALIGYSYFLLHIIQIKLDKNMWHPHIFYTLDSGILRLQGLREDSNFFFFINLIPITLSFYLYLHLKKIFYFISFIILLMANILTFSRSGLLILIILLLFLFFSIFKKVFIPIN
jgi:hypothetical protein